MRYKVGDKVRVRGDLIVGKRYGQYFNKDMAKLINKVITIRKVVNKNFYKIEEDAYYCWTDEMFEPVVVTNWDKVKEEMRIDDVGGGALCRAIHRIRNEEGCNDRGCVKCKKWLKQPYKEPSILDEAEKKYLSAVIRPWRDRVEWISKSDNIGREYLQIELDDDEIELPYFKKGTMYKGMELNKEYTLEDLEI